MASKDDHDAHGDRPCDPGELLRIAYTNSRDLLVELDDLKVSIKQDGDWSATETKRILSMVNRSIQTVFDERKRLDDIAARKDGNSEDGLDFNALRAEIRRRLDELRAAGPSGDIPAQSK